MFQKQIELLCVIFCEVCITGLPFLSFFLFGYCLLFGNITRYLATAYLIHMYFDLKHNEGIFAPIDWFRLSFIFRNVISYFPLKAKLTADIPLDHNYIVGVHPHGFLTQTGFLYALFDQFEPLKSTLGRGSLAFCTAAYNFSIPLQRDWFKSLGAISASETSIMRHLTAAKSGKHVAIILGGAEEASIVSPTEHRLILQKRRGFCRIALLTGSHLIPTYSFGENSLFDTVQPPRGSILQKVQKFLLERFGVGLPILKGSWKYQYFLVTAKRVPLTAVLGKPIPVERVANPTKEEINELHGKYVNALVELFESNKELYLHDKNAKLIID